MSTHHTPGPWKAGAHIQRESGRGIPIGVKDIHSETWGSLAHVYVMVDGKSSPEGEANARLIAAAPDLLAACKAMLADMGTELGFDAAILEMRAAIAKATQP